MTRMAFLFADLLAEFEVCATLQEQHELCILATPTGPRRGVRAAKLFRALKMRAARLEAAE